MTYHDRSYKNRPQNEPREIGRIHRDLAAQDAMSISKISSNLHAIPTAPITTSEGGDSACCCDRVVYVSKDGSGDFDDIQQAIDDIAAYETPSATAPWVIYICPGEYVGDVIMADYVSLVGIGTKEHGARIIGVANPAVITFPDHDTTIENLYIETEIDLGAATSAAVHVRGSTHWIINCSVNTNAINGAGGACIHIDEDVIVHMGENIIKYVGTGTDAAARSHIGVNFGFTNSKVYFTNNEMSIIFDGDNDNGYLFHEEPGVDLTVYVENNIFNIESTTLIGAPSIYNWEANGFGYRYSVNNHWIQKYNGIGGADTAFNLTGGAKLEFFSSHNKLQYDRGITGILAAWAGAETFYSIFDDLDNYTATIPGALAVFKYVISGDANYGTPGNLHISNAYTSDDPPRSRGYRNGNQLIGTGALTIVQTNAETYDSSNIHNTGTYRTIPNVPGYYSVEAQITYQSGVDTKKYYCDILKNGGLAARTIVRTGSAGAIAARCSDIIFCNGSTDFIELRAYHDSGAGKNLSGNTYSTFICVHKLS